METLLLDMTVDMNQMFLSSKGGTKSSKFTGSGGAGGRGSECVLCLKQARHHRRQVRTFHTERNAALANTAHTAPRGSYRQSVNGHSRTHDTDVCMTCA